MKTKNSILTLASLALLCYACSPEETPLKNVSLELPASSFTYTTGTDVPTLGRVLFYDGKLSINNSVSCSSCHKQSLAFADNVAFSVGYENRLTHRNSMPIQNLTPTFFGIREGLDSIVFLPEFPSASTILFWDGRENNLQSMVLKPIINHVEMGISDFDQLTNKLSATSYYPDLFKKAFGSEEITSDKIATALTQFLSSINSNQTKFDASLTGSQKLSGIEQQGRMLFTTTYDCNSCHQIENPHGYVFAGTFANIGLETQYADNGLADVTKRSSDNGKFKIPSLRNVTLTAPYMHDGRFATLDDVLEHYSHGVEDHPNLDFRLRSNGGPIHRDIPQTDKTAIIAFLNTLTDYQMITDEKFSTPFKEN